MRKVTGKKKDVENGDGEEVETVESDEETNGVDEGDPLADENDDDDEEAGEENGEDENDEDDDKPLKASAKKGGKKPAKKAAKKKVTKKRVSLNVPADKVDPDEEYEVESIVDHKYEKNVLMYLIHWKGWTDDDDTWEPKKSLSCPDIIKKYESENDVSAPSATKRGPKGKKRKAGATPTKPSKKVRDESSDEDDGGKEYEVARILEVSVKKNGNREFLVHWKGWSSRFDSWEPEENLCCDDLIAKFDKELSKAKSSSQKELRIAPKTTKRFTAKNEHALSRHSKRGRAPKNQKK